MGIFLGGEWSIACYSSHFQFTRGCAIACFLDRTAYSSQPLVVKAFPLGRGFPQAACSPPGQGAPPREFSPGQGSCLHLGGLDLLLLAAQLGGAGAGVQVPMEQPGAAVADCTLALYEAFQRARPFTVLIPPRKSRLSCCFKKETELYFRVEKKFSQKFKHFTNRIHS